MNARLAAAAPPLLPPTLVRRRPAAAPTPRLPGTPPPSRGRVPRRAQPVVGALPDRSSSSTPPRPAALPASAEARASAGPAVAMPKTPPPPPPPTDEATLRAQHWPADPALHPAPHTPVGVRLEGRDVWVEGCDTPLLAGVSPLAFASGGGGGGRAGAAPTMDLVLGFDAASGSTACEDIPLGVLSVQRFLAGARSKLWWMFPAWGSTGSAVPPETQFLLAQVGPGLYASLTPLIDGGAFRGTLRAASPLPSTGAAPPSTPPPSGDAAGALLLRMESGSPSVLASGWTGALHIAAGTEPLALAEAAVAAAAALSGGARPRTSKPLPRYLDSFGWCSWDAFYSRVSAAGLHAGVASLAAGGAPPRTVIIDDGWQCTDVDPELRRPPPAAVQTAAAAAAALPSATTPAATAATATAGDGVGRVCAPTAPPTPTTPVAGELEAEAARAAAGAARAPAARAGSPAPATPPRAGSAEPAGRAREATPLPPPVPPPAPSSLAGAIASLESAVDAAVAGTADEFEAAEREVLERLAVRDVPAGSSLSSALAQLAPPVDAGAEGGAAGPGLAAPQAQQPPGSSISAMLSPVDHAAGGRLPEQHCCAPHERDGGGGGGAAVATAAAPSPPAVPLPLRPASLGTALLFFFSALAQRAVGLSVGLFEVVVAKLYQYVVDPAPPGSWPVRAFEAAVTGPLKPAMLEFFAASGDFTRRVTAIVANSKFSSPAATAAAYWSGAPSDLGSVVASLRSTHGVRDVLCWHGLSAYWAGVAPPAGHPAVAKYNARLVYAAPTPGIAEVEPSLAWNPAVIAGVGVVEDVSTFYGDLHAYLASCGVSGVKVDGQAGAGLVGSALGGGPATAAAFQSALEASVSTHFAGNTTINCMCHSTENLFRMTSSALVRASDDFYPRDPASSAGHLAACAANSVFLAGILAPDWDMFHSRHPAARAHAAARAASGGPVYVSDAPGCHDFSVLSSLVLEDGRVLRARLPGRPTPSTLFSDPTTDGSSLLTVWNANDFTALVAVMHAQGSTWSRARRRFEVHDRAPPRLGTDVRPADLPLAATRGPTATPTRPWVAHVSGAAGLVLLPSAAEGVRVELAPGDAAVVTLTPVTSLGGPDGGPSFAPVGAASMLNAGGAITAFSLVDAGAVCDAAAVAAGAAAAGAACGAGPDPAAVAAVAAVGVKGLKEILCYSSAEPLAVVDAASGKPLAWRFNARDGALRVAPPRPEGRAVAAACDAACPPEAGAPEPAGDWGFEVALPAPGAGRPPPEEDAAASAAAAVM